MEDPREHGLLRSPEAHFNPENDSWRWNCSHEGLFFRTDHMYVSNPDFFLRILLKLRSMWISQCEQLRISLVWLGFVSGWFLVFEGQPFWFGVGSLPFPHDLKKADFKTSRFWSPCMKWSYISFRICLCQELQRFFDSELEYFSCRGQRPISQCRFVE